MNPFLKASVAAVVTLLVGLGLSKFAVAQKWMDRISWLAAILAPLAVGTMVYLNSK